MIRSWAQFIRLIKLQYIWDWCSRSVYKLEYCYDWCYIILRQWVKLQTSHWCRKPSLEPWTKRGKSRRILHQQLAVPTKALSPSSCMERLLGGRNEREDRSLERIVRSNCFNNLVEITRECHDPVRMVSPFQEQQSTADCRRWTTAAAFQWPNPFWTPCRSRSVSSGQQKGRIGRWLAGQKCSSWTKASFVSHLEIKDLECGDYQERRINQAAPNQVSSFPSPSWSGERWRLVVLDNSVSWSLMLMLKFTSKSLSISCCQQERRSSDALISHFSKTGVSLQCQINNEVARRPWHWGAPLACKFTRPQSNRAFVGTGKKVKERIKLPRGTQRCHSKSVELCHTWGLLLSSFVHATAHSGSYCSKGCCYQVLAILNCYNNSCFC